MKHRIFAAAIVASSLFTVPAMQAATLNLNIPVHAAMDQGKTVKFSVRNDTKTPVTVKAGDQQVTLQPGKSSSFKLAVGTQMTTLTATANHQAGDVIANVDTDLSGNTLILN